MHLRLLVLSLLLTAPATAADWPRFHGPNGTGTADDKTIPVAFTAKDTLWKVPLDGEGRSSPIVCGKRLYLQTADPDGGKRHLLCLDIADGRTLWSADVPGTKVKANARNSLASSTPTTDGTRIYAHFWDGARVALYGFDLNGMQLWKYDLGPYTSQHGAANSPIVHAGKVYILNEDDKGAAVVAVDAASGKLLWERKREPYRACYSTPFLLERQNEGVELIVGSTTALTSYNPDTGEQNWQFKRGYEGKPLRTVAAPALAGGLLIAGSGDGAGDRDTVAVIPGSKARGAEPKEAWHTGKRQMPYVPCFLSHGEHLYWVNDQGTAGCTVARTGEVVWAERLGGKLVTSSPVLIAGKIYVADEAGTVFVYAAAPAFKLLAKNPLDEPVLASPAVADGRLYIRGEKHLFCIGHGAK